MNKISANKVGLVFGALLALWHVMWATLVFLGLARPLLNFILAIHFLHFEYHVEHFVFSKALLLVVITGSVGYVLGYLIGWLWNMVQR
jgi:hypothetical protein